jgi:hypothetical protein
MITGISIPDIVIADNLIASIVIGKFLGENSEK